MTTKEKALELKDKFGSNAISRVLDTIDVWETKKRIELKNGTEKGLQICERTLKYWQTVKKELC